MKTVLIVDDSEFDRLLLQRLLERRAYRVLGAKSGEDALSMVESQPVDAILLDGLLPGLQGKDVLIRLRERRDARELPVLMVSGRAESSEIAEALRLGANDYVTKPIDFASLEKRLAAALESR